MKKRVLLFIIHSWELTGFANFLPLGISKLNSKRANVKNGFKNAFTSYQIFFISNNHTFLKYNFENREAVGLNRER